MAIGLPILLFQLEAPNSKHKGHVEKSNPGMVSQLILSREQHREAIVVHTRKQKGTQGRHRLPTLQEPMRSEGARPLLAVILCLLAR